MKRIKYFLLTTVMLLVSASGMAQSHYSYDPGKYVSNMTITAKLMDGENPVVGAEVGAFIDGECRYTTNSITMGYCFITVQGSGYGGNIEFRVWYNNAEIIVPSTLVYRDNDAIGDFSNPHVIQLADGAEAGKVRTDLYPGTNSAQMVYTTSEDILSKTPAANSLLFADAQISGITASNVVSKDAAGKWVAKSIVMQDAQPFHCPQEVQVSGNITYTRTFSHANWQALYLPFEVVYDDNFKTTIGQVAYINNVHQYDQIINGSVETVVEYLSVPVGKKLKANYPYVIMPVVADGATPTVITAQATTLYPTTSETVVCQSATRKYTFTGIYQPKTDMYTSGAYALTSTNMFSQASSDAVTLSPFRFCLLIENTGSAYDDASSSNNVKVSMMVDGVIQADDEDAISHLHNGSQRQQPEIYNLQGQRVARARSGQVYIINGKKTLLR